MQTVTLVVVVVVVVVVVIVVVVADVAVLAFCAALTLALHVVPTRGDVAVVGAQTVVLCGLLQAMWQLSRLVEVLLLLPGAVQELAGGPVTARVLEVVTESRLRLAGGAHVVHSVTLAAASPVLSTPVSVLAALSPPAHVPQEVSAHVVTARLHVITARVTVHRHGTST